MIETGYRMRSPISAWPLIRSFTIINILHPWFYSSNYLKKIPAFSFALRCKGAYGSDRSNLILGLHIIYGRLISSPQNGNICVQLCIKIEDLALLKPSIRRLNLLDYYNRSKAIWRLGGKEERGVSGSRTI